MEPFIQDSWRNIYSGWKDKDKKWYWKKYNLKFEEFDNYFEIVNSLQILNKYKTNTKLWTPALNRVITRAPSMHIKNLAREMLDETI